MRLIEACKAAKECGLETLDEALTNIEHMAMSMFPYKDIPTEILEMYEDPLWKQLDITVKDNITTVLEHEH